MAVFMFLVLHVVLHVLYYSQSHQLIRIYVVYLQIDLQSVIILLQNRCNLPQENAYIPNFLILFWSSNDSMFKF